MMVKNDATYHHHEPVLLDESIDHLVTDPHGIYVDATLGGGGHTAALLDALADNAIVYGIDQDDEALQFTKERIQNDPRFRPLKGNFGYLSTLLPPQTHGKITGFLFDLGVSTHQISEAERGFSFQREGPLDMRMGNLQHKTAYEVVNEYDYESLRDVIYHFGEERNSRPIAKAIIDRRPVETTDQLKQIVASVVKGPHQIKSIARVFQGIRIEVNNELEMLRDGLEQALDLLQEDGRIVAISYHSLEDRIVKRFFKTGNHQGEVKKDFYGNDLSPVKMLYNDLIRPSDEEIERNSAARSAKMRIAEKIGEVDA